MCDCGDCWACMAPEHDCDSGDFDRVVCPDPCNTMHSYCSVCGDLQDECLLEE